MAVLTAMWVNSKVEREKLLNLSSFIEIYTCFIAWSFFYSFILTVRLPPSISLPNTKFPSHFILTFSRIYLENLRKLQMNLSQKNISNQLNIKLGQFTQELNLRKKKEKLKIEKLQGLMKYHQKYGRQGNSTTYCSDAATPYITRTQ